MKDKKEKIKKEKSKAVDVNITPTQKIEDTIEDKPEIDVHPRCTMELIKNEETNTLDVVYSKGCSGGTVREIAGILALDGVRFKPLIEKTKEEIKEEFDKKVLACKLGNSEACAKSKQEIEAQIREAEGKLKELKAIESESPAMVQTES